MTAVTTLVSPIRGSAQLVLDIVDGTTAIVESLHRSIVRSTSQFLVSPPEVGELLVDSMSPYWAIHATTRGLHHGLRLVSRPFERSDASNDHGETNTKIVGALNGICGDHLAETDNPLAAPMRLHTSSRVLDLTPEGLAEGLDHVSPDIVVMVHGLGLSHEYWHQNADRSLGHALHERADVSVLYVNYNTGLHISTNGQELTRQLEQVVANWPVEVRTLNIIGHSMGGLVTRSACWYAEEAGSAWLKPLAHAVYMGSPHHGAALAKGSHLLTYAMLQNEHSAPFAFGQYTSAGIKDLRHGNLLDEDWYGIEQDHQRKDNRRAVPLTEHAEHYFLAASIGGSKITRALLGDLLVRLGSATGQHRDDLKRLISDPDHCRVVPGLHHLELLDNGVVRDQIVDWLTI